MSDSPTLYPAATSTMPSDDHDVSVRQSLPKPFPITLYRYGILRKAQKDRRKLIAKGSGYDPSIDSVRRRTNMAAQKRTKF